MSDWDNVVLTWDAKVLGITPQNRDGNGAVVIADQTGDTSLIFDLVAARRLARVLLRAAEEAEVADPEPGEHFAGTVEFGGKVKHLTINDAVRLAKIALDGGAEL